MDCSAAPYTPPIHEYSHDHRLLRGHRGGFRAKRRLARRVRRLLPLRRLRVQQDLRAQTEQRGRVHADASSPAASVRAGRSTWPSGPTDGSGALLHHLRQRRGGAPHRLHGRHQPLPERLLDGEPHLGPAAPGGQLRRLGQHRPGRGRHADATSGTSATAPATQRPPPRRRATPTPTKGTYTASLRVRDNHGALSDPATVRIDAGNRAPTPAIGSPSAGPALQGGPADHPERKRHRSRGRRPAGELLGVGGPQTPQRRPHPPLLLGHRQQPDHHRPAPEGISATGRATTWRYRLTATDSEGLSKTVTREVQPHRVDVSFATNPSGLSVQADDLTFAAPRTLVSWEGYTLSVNAPSPQALSGKTYVFSSWSDGKGQQHDIVTGATPSTYTAAFKACTKTGTTGADDTLDGTSGEDVICGLGRQRHHKGPWGQRHPRGHGRRRRATRRRGGGQDQGRTRSRWPRTVMAATTRSTTKDGVSGNDTLDGGTGTDTRTTDATEKSIFGFPVGVGRFSRE